MSKTRLLFLPYPPSVNHYYRHAKNGGVYISPEGKQYRRIVLFEIAKCSWRNDKLRGRLLVDVTLHSPRNDHRDIDNPMKSLLDALQFAGVYDSDSQIDKLIITRGNVHRRAGLAVVTIVETAD